MSEISDFSRSDMSNKSDSSDKITFEGYLKQKIGSGIFGNKMRRYYMKLEHKILKKYDEMMEKCFEEYKLSDYNVIDGSFITAKKCTILFIHHATNEKTYFYCDTEFEFKQWIYFLTYSRTNAEFDDKTDILAIESILEPCVVADNFGVILGFNAEAEKLFGYSKTEMMGKSVTLLMPDTYAKVHDNYLENYRKTDTTRLIGKPRRLPIKRKDGSRIFVTVSLGRSRQKGKSEVLISTFKHINDDIDHNITNNTNEIELRKINLCGKITETCEGIRTEIKNDYDYFIKLLKYEEEKIKACQEENNKLNDKIAELYAEIRKIKEDNIGGQSDTFTTMIRILSNDVTFKAFLEFSRQKHCEENLLFWKSVNDMKKDFEDKNDKDIMMKTVNSIYNQYILSDKLNISKPLIENIRDRIDNKHIGTTIFDIVVKDVLTLIHTNLYKNFVSTGIGKVCVGNVE